jgi:hypothetical protein
MSQAFVLEGSYNYRLVALSLVIAFLASGSFLLPHQIAQPSRPP